MRAALATLGLFCLCFAAGADDPVGIPLPEPEPITVRITAPESGALIGGTHVRVTGEVTGTATAQVTINGLSVPSEHGLFSYWLPVDGTLSTIEVVHPESGASDSVTINVDDLVPLLTIAGPPRGATVSGASAIGLLFSASDESGITRVAVAGKDQSPTGPDWEVDVPIVDGMNTIRVEVEDGAGNTALEHVSVLSGEFGSPADEIDDAVVLHIGPLGLRTFNTLVASLAGELDYTALAQSQNPIIDSSLAKVSIETVAIGDGTQVFVTAVKDTLTIQVTVFELVATSSLELYAPGGAEAAYNVEFAIGKVALQVPLAIAAKDGVYDVELLEPTFDFQEPEVTVTDEGGEVPATAGIEGPVLESLEKLLTDTALKLGAESIQLGLAKITEPLTYTVIDTDITVDLSAVDVDVDTHGIELRLSGSLSVAGETAVDEDPGVLRTPSTKAFHPRSDFATLGISDDLVNLILHEIWRIGTLQVTIDQAMLDELKAPVYFVAGFLGGLVGAVGDEVDPEDPLILKIITPLPPVMTTVPDSKAIGVALGDLTLDFSTETTALARGVISLRMAAGAVTEADSLLLELFPFNIGFDLETDDTTVKRKVEGTVEPFVTALLEELSPLFSEIIGALPLPDLGRVKPASLSATDSGDGQYLVLSGVLQVVEDAP